MQDLSLVGCVTTWGQNEYEIEFFISLESICLVNVIRNTLKMFTLKY